jgi:hypothetical protein
VGDSVERLEGLLPLVPEPLVLEPLDEAAPPLAPPAPPAPPL